MAFRTRRWGPGGPRAVGPQGGTDRGTHPRLGRRAVMLRSGGRWGVGRLANSLVLYADSAGALRALTSVRARLTEAEQARAARLRSADDRDDYLAAHLLVRECAARWSGVPAELLTLRQLCPGCGSSGHGRPYIAELPGISVSLSHTRGCVAAATGLGPVAVDTENHRRRTLPEASQHEVLTAADHAAVAADPRPDLALALRWTYKECLVKLGATDWGRLREAGTPQALRPDGIPVRTDGRWAVQWANERESACGTAVTAGVPALLGLEAMKVVEYAPTHETSRIVQSCDSRYQPTRHHQARSQWDKREL
ncbi:4'-phosphopantetheinyl transferase family protein [Streptomyces sp. SCSIO 30461]|uniref:4'-phosphopantetheinyl transferase family protein n=1 Tax=Streptomyces sp. SCSIO 30461 TaxID=3118085 RepID=UPI00387E5375